MFAIFLKKVYNLNTKKPLINLNRKKIKKAIGIFTVAVGLRYGYGKGTSITTTSNSTQQVKELNNYGGNNLKITEASKSALEVRCGDFKKAGPGARAKADARLNAGTGRSRSGSSIIPGADGFVPQRTYHHRNAPLSCKTATLKLKNDPFQDYGDNNQPPFEDGKYDPSKYKGGPSPFQHYDYKDPAVVAQNIGFNNLDRLNKSYDKHAKDCFGMVDTRNKENLEIFKENVRNFVKSPNKVYKGSYRYEDPAYVFFKETGSEQTIVVVNATNQEYITAYNPTATQMDNLTVTGNLGFDARPNLRLLLRLRSPK